jgi:hypothetical protein
MRWSDIPFNPPVRTLRQFAVLWIVACLGLAALQWFRDDNHVLAIILAAATVVGFWGCWRPRDLRPIFVGWMVLAFPIGWTISTLLLAFMFYAIFTPLALVFRLLRRDLLRLRRDPKAETYWQPKRMTADPKSYLNQF